MLKIYYYLLCGPNESEDAQKIIHEIGSDLCESLSNKNISEIKDYISISDLYVGNDSFGHHISSQMGKPSFVILLDTPRAYSDYSVNQKRILPPSIDINEITHDSRLDPITLSALFFSKAPVITLRTIFTFCHLLFNFEFLYFISTLWKSSKCTLDLNPLACQASSHVKLKEGASHLTRKLKIKSSNVREDRLLIESIESQYMVSLRISK